MRTEVRERIAMIERGEVPDGYENKGNGINPIGWYPYFMGELFDFSGGISASREQLSSNGICYLHYGDIHKTNKTYIDIDKEYDLIPKLDIKVEKIPEKTLLHHGDVVFVDASEDYDGVNKCITIENEKKIPFISGLHTIIAKSKSEKLNTKYKRYCFQSDSVKRQFNYYASGMKVFGLSKSNIVKIKLIVPSYDEQEEIASILSSWDRAIELKEKLLAQKKLHKKGLMERLLTGKVRLPECSKEWKLIKISELLTMCERPIKLDDDMQYEQITIRRNYGGVESRGFSAGKSILVTTQFLVRQNDFVISRRQIAHGACGVVPVELNGAIVSNEYDVFTANEELDVHFFSYLMQLPIFKYRFYVFSNGVHIEKMIFHTKTWLKSEIKLPRYEEQVKIREMLDKEQMAIDLLTKEIDQLKIQKKGLMQLLLTGKVRVSC